MSKKQENDFFEFSQESLKKTIAFSSLMLFAVFVAGYYLGKKTAVEFMMADIEGNAFADKIYSSLCTLYPVCIQEAGSSSEEEEQGDSLPEIIDGSQDDEETKRQDSNEETIKSIEVKLPLYQAYLAGYSNKAVAEKYKAKLQSRALDAFVIERSGQTARGKKKTWYQVVLGPLPKPEIDEVVDRVKKMDKLTDVDILEYCEGTSA